MLALFDHVNTTMPVGAASHLVRLRDVYVYNNRIHHIDRQNVLTIYETARAIDRPDTTQPDLDADGLRAAALDGPEGRASFYMGMPGFANYGHWLIDELPHLAAFDRVRAEAPDARIVIPGAGPVINRVKEQSVRLLRPQLGAEDILYIPYLRPVRFRSLYYATPVTSHPGLKCPSACRDLRLQAWEQLGGTPLGSGDRIFVMRRQERGRALMNLKQVSALFKRHGFRIVDPGAMDFSEQVAVFRAATLVAGGMGAAMTNAVFCRPGATILHLVPDGWLEPFYWDLAAACGHRYAAMFGARPDTSIEPHKSSFSIDVNELRRVLDHLQE